MTGNVVVLSVALLAWGLLWFYLSRLERRIKTLEKSGLQASEVPKQ